MWMPILDINFSSMNFCWQVYLLSEHQNKSVSIATIESITKVPILSFGDI